MTRKIKKSEIGFDFEKIKGLEGAKYYACFSKSGGEKPVSVIVCNKEKKIFEKHAHQSQFYEFINGIEVFENELKEGCLVEIDFGEVDLFYSSGDYTFDDLHEALEHLVDNANDLDEIIGLKIEVYEKQVAQHEHFIDAESVLEVFSGRAKGYLSEVAYKAKDEAKEAIRQAQLKELEDSIVAWLNKYAAQPHFYMSKNRLDDIDVTWQLLKQNDFLPQEE